MTIGTKSLLALSVCAALFATACKKKDEAGTGSGTATATASGAGTATASGAGTATASAAPPAVDAAEAAAPAIDAAEAAASAASLTPELKALHETLAPIVAMTDADARSKAACAAKDTINKQMIAVDRNPPAGVDAAAWTAIAERMSGGMDDMAIECAEDSYTNAKNLSDALEVAKELEALVAKKAP